MPLPSSPTAGTVASDGGRTYQWDGYAWVLASNVAGHAASHAASGSDPLSLAASQISGLATVATSGSAADLSGTLADARLSSNVPLLPRMLLGWSKPSGVIDVVNRENTNNNALTVVSGTAMYIMFTPLVTTTVSQITFFSGNVAASGLTLARFGLFTFTETSSTTSAVLVARTASDTTLFTSTSTSWSRSLDTASGFPATYTLVAGTRYAVGLVVTGTTMPQLAGNFVSAGPCWLVTPRVCGLRASQTDLGDMTTMQPSSFLPFARLS